MSAEFSRGWTGETVYDHLATLSLNNTPVGSAIVPQQSRIEGTLSPTALVMSGPTPRQLLNVRSDHTNQAHFTVASDFQMTLNFGPHVRTQCFSVEELQSIGLVSFACLPEADISEEVSFTNLRLKSEHSALQSAMFWAIYNETSEDRVYYGGDSELEVDDEQPSTRVSRDSQGIQAASFLVNDPFCTEGGESIASDEQLGVENDWDADIFRIDHCSDHRYLAANVLINASLYYERSIAHDPNIAESIMGAVYGYYPINFGGTFGENARENELWSGIEQCVQGYLGPYPLTLINRSGTGEVTYTNFGDLAMDNARINLALNQRSKVQSKLNVLRNDDIDDNNQSEQINQLETQINQANSILDSLP